VRLLGLLAKPSKMRRYCNCYNYRRNGNVAVPGLFISSGRKQRGNYLEWRSRKKKGDGGRRRRRRRRKKKRKVGFTRTPMCMSLVCCILT